MNCRRPIPAPATTQSAAVTHPGAATRRVPAGAHWRRAARTLQARAARQEFALTRSPIRDEGETPGPRHFVPGHRTPGDPILPPGSHAARGTSCRPARALARFGGAPLCRQPGGRNPWMIAGDTFEHQMEGVKGQSVPRACVFSTSKFRGRA